MKTATYDERQWRLVPVVATDEMDRAMTEAFSLTDMDGIYQAALESAPKLVGSIDRVECRRCDVCDHIGLNDASETQGACHECDWRGPEQIEDKCPGCGKTDCMAAACPECGGRYCLITEHVIEAAPQPGEVVGAAVFAVYCQDMGGADHFSLGPGIPPWAQRKVTPLYTHPVPGAARDADAARYRWLRNDHNGDLCAGHEQDDGYVHILEGRILDDAIDAAMAARRTA